LEVRVWRILLDGGLPPPVRQYEVRHNRRLVARVDFAYPHANLAIEADGYHFHASAPDWRRDRMRQNALTSLGWIVYSVTWDDTVRGRARIIADLSGLLRRAVTHNGR
jgi:very-short-patch-repair endonuclease